MTWRRLLLDGPAYLITHLPGALTWLFRAYWLLIAAMTLLCFTTAVLTLGLWLLGVPIPLPPPPPVPVEPGGPNAAVLEALIIGLPH